MMATLRRFMALLLVVRWRDLAGKPEPTFPDHAQKPGFWRALGAQKGSPAKRTGHTLRVAAQCSQKTLKNNGLFGVWLAHFRDAAPLNCSFPGLDRPRAALPRSGF